MKNRYVNSYGPVEKLHILGEKKGTQNPCVLQILNVLEMNVTLTSHAIYHHEFRFCISFIFISESYLENTFYCTGERGCHYRSVGHLIAIASGAAED